MSTPSIRVVGLFELSQSQGCHGLGARDDSKSPFHRLLAVKPSLRSSLLWVSSSARGRSHGLPTIGNSGENQNLSSSPNRGTPRAKRTHYLIRQPNVRVINAGYAPHLCLVLILVAVAAFADDEPGHSSHGSAFDSGMRTRPWEMGGIGEAPFPITAKNPEVQKWFNQGNACCIPSGSRRPSARSGGA